MIVLKQTFEYLHLEERYLITKKVYVFYTKCFHRAKQQVVNDLKTIPKIMYFAVSSF